MTYSPNGPFSYEVGLLLALRVVRGGQLTVSGPPEVFRDRGEPLADVLVPFLRELFAHGHVRLDEAEGDAHRVVMTTAGAELLAELGDEPHDPQGTGHG